jgi:glycosyltransferase involved in cell wall biosynthesis
LVVDHRARRLAANHLPGLFHVMDGSHAYLARHFPPAQTLVTCHDLIPLRMCLGLLGRRPRWPARLLIRRSAAALRSAAMVLADSSSTARDATELAGVQPEKIRIIPPALGGRWLRFLNRPHAPRTGSEAYLLHVGHGAAYKNRPAVWQIFRRIASRWPGKLCIAGEPASPSLRAEIQAAGLQSRVFFIPFPEDDRLESLYSGASLFLFPSLFEGFGWPPLEALACGCPAIASEVGGLRDALGEEYPFLFPPSDEGAMAQAALSLLETPRLAAETVQAARHRLADNGPDRMSGLLVSAYRELLGESA